MIWYNMSIPTDSWGAFFITWRNTMAKKTESKIEATDLNDVQRKKL